jgi:GntR family transcriptional repressor for pyruvate dehydrogenase complex
MAEQKIARENVSDVVFDTLRQEIISGVYKAEDRLPSAAKLSGQFGVSIATIKLALNRLKVLGLIEIKNGLGSFVLNFDPHRYLDQVTDFFYSENDIAAVTEFRLSFEPLIAELAMQNAREENFCNMEALLNKMDEATQKKDFNLHGNLDYQFHLEIAKATQNIMFVLAYELIGKICRKHTIILNELYHQKAEQGKEDVHWRLYRAIREKDYEVCRECYAEMLWYLIPEGTR